MKQEPSLNQEEYLNCKRSPAYHQAGFTYTLFSAMFLSIRINNTIIIVSLVVLVVHLGTFPPTRLLSGIKSRCGSLEIKLKETFYATLPVGLCDLVAQLVWI